MQLYKLLGESIIKNAKRNAFRINEVFYTYSDFAKSISNIRKRIQNSISESDAIIGLVANDDLETYASIVALWLEGKAYVPISTETPAHRNEIIIDQAGIETIFDSCEIPLFPGRNVICSKNLPETAINLTPKPVSDKDLCFILFTSGTTGTPKGVPINGSNLEGFLEAMSQIGVKLDENDRGLQMFEITFDMSVVSYLMPLLKGGCVYTIPKGQIKYSYIYDLMEDHKLTVLFMVPSILLYLRPYFDEIRSLDVKYCVMAGEALPLDLTEEWSRCVPNAIVINAYGPTESTIFCTSYQYALNQTNKSHNGILCIGKPLYGVETIIIDDDHNILPSGEKGELCLAGKLLSSGYWNNDQKNKEAFFLKNFNGKPTRFYKTGDLCLEDHSGDIMYLGRIDFQTKIQGYRVELSEIEYHAKKALNKINVVAVPYSTRIGSTELGMVIESIEFDTSEMIEYMKSKVDEYMIPKKIQFIDKFPLNMNGKIDRKELKNMF
jgi:D-alanine--poly(phosphoribitol) ligase subunit 1